MNSHTFADASSRMGRLRSEDYELQIRQGPERARVAGVKEKDRKPVDPPPIIQLRIKDDSDPQQNYLQSPYYFMCTNLYPVHDSGNGSSTAHNQALAGTLVSSLHRLKDIDNSDGGFFVFGDLSVKVEGEFRLRFSLFEMLKDEVVHLKSVTSESFKVYAAKNFPGMSESTFLSRSFGDQGVRLRIRKEPRTLLKRPNPGIPPAVDYQRGYVPSEQEHNVTNRDMHHLGQHSGYDYTTNYHEQTKRTKMEHDAHTPREYVDHSQYGMSPSSGQSSYNAMSQAQYGTYPAHFGGHAPQPPYSQSSVQKGHPPNAGVYSQNSSSSINQGPLSGHSVYSQYAESYQNNSHPIEQQPGTIHPQNPEYSYRQGPSHSQPSQVPKPRGQSPYTSPRLQYHTRSPTANSLPYRGHSQSGPGSQPPSHHAQAQYHAPLPATSQSSSHPYGNNYRQDSVQQTYTPHTQSPKPQNKHRQSLSISNPHSAVLGNPPSPPRTAGYLTPHATSPSNTTGSASNIPPPSPSRLVHPQSYSLPPLQLPPLSGSQSTSPVRLSPYGPKERYLHGPPSSFDSAAQQSFPQFSTV